jgi:hypothetical protein
VWRPGSVTYMMTYSNVYLHASLLSASPTFAASHASHRICHIHCHLRAHTHGEPIVPHAPRLQRTNSCMSSSTRPSMPGCSGVAPWGPYRWLPLVASCCMPCAPAISYDKTPTNKGASPRAPAVCHDRRAVGDSHV